MSARSYHAPVSWHYGVGGFGYLGDETSSSVLEDLAAAQTSDAFDDAFRRARLATVYATDAAGRSKLRLSHRLRSKKSRGPALSAAWRPSAA